MSILDSSPATTGWVGGNDAWTEADVVFETWLMAMSLYRHEDVMAEALTVREPKPQPHPRPRPLPKPTRAVAPAPRPAPEPAPAVHIPTELETFTDQQIHLAERMLGLTKENN